MKTIIILFLIAGICMAILIDSLTLHTLVIFLIQYMCLNILTLVITILIKDKFKDK